jgi:hypothetical protein
MIATVFLALGTFCSAVPGDESRPEAIHESRITSHRVVIDSTYKALFESGETFADFVAKATARKEQWEGNYSRQVAPDALVTRAAAAGSWRLLVVTVPGCSDSVNIVPYMASFLDKVPSIEMRLINPTLGKAVMEAHRTPDGRAATPTVILLDAEFNERGCWIERPATLIELMKNGTTFEGKMEWYDKDRGASSLEEIVQMIEAAHAGSVKCPSKAP